VGGLLRGAGEYPDLMSEIRARVPSLCTSAYAVTLCAWWLRQSLDPRSGQRSCATETCTERSVESYQHTGQRIACKVSTCVCFVSAQPCRPPYTAAWLEARHTLKGAPSNQSRSRQEWVWCRKVQERPYPFTHMSAERAGGGGARGRAGRAGGAQVPGRALRLLLGGHAAAAGARARAAARGPAALGYAAASSCAAATKWPRDGPEASRSLPAAGRLASETSALRSWPRDTSVHPCCVVCHDMRTQDGPVTCRYGIFLKFQDMARLGLRTGAADVWRVRAPGPAADGAGRVHVARAVWRADRAAQLLPLGHQRLHRGGCVRAPPAAVRPRRHACQPATSRWCSGLQRCAPRRRGCPARHQPVMLRAAAMLPRRHAWGLSAGRWRVLLKARPRLRKAEPC